MIDVQLLTPLFLYAHVELWRASTGIGWWTLSRQIADLLTIATIVFAVLLWVGRLSSHTSRFISRKQDFLWPILLIIPFVSGYVCANGGASPVVYQLAMLVHILSAELIFILLPFTKIAHCVLMPLSQLISGIAWKFPAETDDAVCTTLNKKGAPV